MPVQIIQVPATPVSQPADAMTATQTTADSSSSAATPAPAAVNTGIVPPALQQKPCGCKGRQMQQPEADEYGNHIRLAAILGNVVLVLLCVYFTKRIFFS